MEPTAEATNPLFGQASPLGNIDIGSIKEYYGLYAVGGIIVIFILRFFLRRHVRSDEDELFIHRVEPLQFGTYTPETLAKYNGKDDPHVLIAVRGKIYDVTAGRNFYGPGGPYANFAGRDATRGLAKSSFDDEMLTPLDKPIDLIKDLTETELTTLKDWETLFEAKYPICGELVNSDKFK